MIQDIAPHQYHNEYKPVSPSPEDIILFYEGRNVLAHLEEGILSYPTVSEYVSRTGGDPKALRYLFRIDDTRFYLASQLDPSAFPEYQMEAITLFREADPQYLAFACITGHQLYDWYRTRTYCGCCGSRMKHSPVERMMECPSCKTMEYPKISPAVIVGVTHGDRLLLSKYAGRSFTRYALLAGFHEVGETIEETVKREVMEEVGVPVKNIRYFNSQPWSASSSLLMGFYCDLDGDDETITLDEQELALAEWFDRDQIPVKPSRESLTNLMIQTFIKNEEPKVK